MPSPKAVLRDIADFKLNPKVAHTKAGSDGRIHGKVAHVKTHVEVGQPETVAPVEVAEVVKEVLEEKKAPAAQKQAPPAPKQSAPLKNDKKAAIANDSAKGNLPVKQEVTEAKVESAESNGDPDATIVT